MKPEEISLPKSIHGGCKPGKRPPTSVMRKRLVAVALEFFRNEIVFSLMIFFAGRIGSCVRGAMPNFDANEFKEKTPKFQKIFLK